MGSSVPDIRLVQQLQFPQRQSVQIDWQLLDDGTLDDTQALASAVVLALGTDAMASEDDVLPDPDSTDREGWWGDYEADIIWNAWPIGSKLWLLRRSAIEPPGSRNGATTTAVQGYIAQAIGPFVQNGIISSYDLYVYQVNTQRIDARIVLYRGPTPQVTMLYSVLWDALIADQ
jgi:phage gp46-like protein